jgi:hypothetical protein
VLGILVGAGHGLISLRMVGIGQRMSTVSQDSGGGGGRPTSKDGNKKNIWSSMLDNVASGKRLPEKNMIVLGTWIQRSLFCVLLSLQHDINSVKLTFRLFSPQEAHLKAKENS